VTEYLVWAIVKEMREMIDDQRRRLGEQCDGS